LNVTRKVEDVPAVADLDVSADAEAPLPGELG
jgi:hypothetical protein